MTLLRITSLQIVELHFGTGNFIFLSGQTITGEVGLFDQIDVVVLNASGLEFSGNQSISVETWMSLVT